MPVDTGEFCFGAIESNRQTLLHTHDNKHMRNMGLRPPQSKNLVFAQKTTKDSNLVQV